MYKIEYSTTRKWNLKKEFPKMEEIDNFIKKQKINKGIYFSENNR